MRYASSQVDNNTVGGVAVAIGLTVAAAGQWSYLAVERAVQMTQAGAINAIVTAPLCREALHLAGHPFEGLTEMLAYLTGMRDGVMMLAHDGMRVSHVTTHRPLSEVPKHLTPVRLSRVLDVTIDALRALGIPQPRIAVAGLNLHAGEGGNLGEEDGDPPTQSRSEGSVDTGYYKAPEGSGHQRAKIHRPHRRVYDRAPWAT